MTTLKIATVNDDWASQGTNYPDVADCDVVLIQEGKREDYASLVDSKTHGVLQDRSSKATAGSVIIWALTAVAMQKTGLRFAVHADGLLTRYLAWLRSKVGDRRILFIAAHRPPKRSMKWWHRFDLALAARVRLARATHRLVIVGIDTNTGNHRRMARMCGLKWHSTDGKRIDGFLMSKHIKVTALHALPKHTSDHQPLVAIVEIPAAWLKPKPVPKPDPVKSYPPITAARTQSHDGPQFGEGECLQQVRTCYGIPARDPSAAAAWDRAEDKHPTRIVTSIPRGYPIFWTGGSHGFGHIAIYAGGGMCWSTDIRRTGFFDYVPVSEIHAQWGLTFVGWTEDINGVTCVITN